MMQTVLKAECEKLAKYLRIFCETNREQNTMPDSGGIHVPRDRRVNTLDRLQNNAVLFPPLSIHIS